MIDKAANGLCQRNLWCFVGLVAAAVLCICLMVYSLFYARTREGLPVHSGAQSVLRLPSPQAGTVRA